MAKETIKTISKKQKVIFKALKIIMEKQRIQDKKIKLIVNYLLSTQKIQEIE